MAKTSFALITGASKGIGKEIALELARRGYNLVLTARNELQLAELAAYLRKKYSIRVEFFAGDLEISQTADKLLQFCETRNLPVNILVNNAGFGYIGSFSKNDLDTYLGMIDVNNKALVKLTHIFIPMLEQNGPSYVMNLASIAGFITQPSSPIYGATKAFVVSFSKALAYNLKKDGSKINITCLCPGLTATEFFKRSGRDIDTTFYDAVMMSPAIVARDGVRGMFAKKLIVFSGFSNWLMGTFVKFIPDRVVMTMFNWLGF